MSRRYSEEELERVRLEKSLREMPEEDYLEDSRILKDLGIQRLAHRNAIIDEAGRRSLNVLQLRSAEDGWQWFQDQPVTWLLGKVEVKPSTVWCFYHVASVRGQNLYDTLSDFGIFIQLGDGNFLSNFINRRGVNRFQKIFWPILAIKEDTDLKKAWKEVFKIAERK